MKLIRGTVTAALLALPWAAASPATTFYSAATSAINDDYYGWSTKNFSLLAGEYAQTLEDRCAPRGDQCDFGTARGVVKDLLAAFGDAHLSLRDAQGAQRLREIAHDLAVQRTGLQVVRAEGGLLVASVMPGSPAALAGVRRLDLLIQVAGQEAGKRGGHNSPIGPSEFVHMERLGQPISVVLRRAGQPDQPLSLSTAQLKARDEPSLTWSGPDGKTAVIVYPSFLPADSAAQFLKLVQYAQTQEAKALIVDLRFNSGGSLSQCVAAASVFGPVVYDTELKVGGYSYTGLLGQPSGLLETLNAPASARVWKSPAAVLVGSDTASCAEVFSFYAQQAGVSVIGLPTRGVGNSGVIFHDLPDGGVLGVTVLRAFTRDGQPLPDHITPDIAAPTDLDLLIKQGRDQPLDTALTALGQVTSPPNATVLQSGTAVK
ncbi:S41 family peptidase [Deinococcus sp.]|uniref:S41 family peptidase n=1 Tax=Deinococcus sp. TaxID=47478 RepID=UPI0025BB6420|nr:S41 family peptidase [Deinococcus sp.]